MEPGDLVESIPEELFRGRVPGRPRGEIAALIDALPIGLFWKDLRSFYLGCNAAFARDAGIASPAEIVGLTDFDLAWSSIAEKVREDDRAVMESGIARLGYEDPVTLRDGRRVWHHKNKLPIRGPDGRVVGVLGTYEDVSERRLAEERLALAIEGSGVGLWDWQVAAGKLEVNERWAGICGYRLEELEHLSIETWKRLCEPGDFERAQAALEAHFSGRSPTYECEVRMRHKEGRWIWVLDRGKLFERDPEGRPLRMSGTHLDITERKRLEEELLLAATRDKLTGALNRRAGLEALARELKAAERRGSSLAVGFVDVDGLKEVNDSLGHAAGDLLLASAARVLSLSLRETDLLARLGGDEFLLILPDCGQGEAEAIWDRVERSAREPAEGPAVAMSHGFAFRRGAEGLGLDALVAMADAKMYADKRSRKKGR